MAMTKTGIVAGKAKKIETDEDLAEFEKIAQGIRRDLKKQAEKVKRDAKNAS